MQIVFETNGTTLVAKLSGELDHHSASGIREKVDLKLTSGIYHSLILDFEEVTFMDSSGIGVIMGRVKNMALSGGTVSVANPNGNVEKILDVLAEKQAPGGLDQYISILQKEGSDKGGLR